MKRLHSFVLICVSFISIVLYSPTFAGNRPGALTITPAVGYDFFASKRHLENTSLGAIMIGYNLTEHWGVEGFLGFLNTKFNKSVNDNRQVNGTIFAFDGVYHFMPVQLFERYMPVQLFEPYVLAGVGITGLNPNRMDSNNEGNINGAAGFQLFLHKSIALRFEARDFYTIIGGENDVILSAGLSVLLDLC